MFWMQGFYFIWSEEAIFPVLLAAVDSNKVHLLVLFCY